MSKTILAIGAHPDDIEFSCTGTLLKLKEKGYQIYYIIATNGENGFKIKHKPTKQRIQIRHHEQLNAAEKLGVKEVFFLNYRDGYLIYNNELREKLVKIIKKVKPEIIFSFDPANRDFESINLNHRDHRNIGEAVFDSVFAARNRYMYPGELHSISYFYFFGTNIHLANHFENITKYIEKKLEILKEHKSQFDDFEKAADWVKSYVSGFSKKYKYSERFRLVKVEQVFTQKIPK